MIKINEKEVSQREIKIVDLFCGIGGFRKGFEQTGIKTKCVLSADIDEYATAVYNYNFKENKKPTDITKLKSEEIPDHDILCSGFPCQNFSIAGKRKGFNGTRGTLFFEICRIARDKKTPILFLENVKGLLSHGNRTTGIFYDKCKKTYSTKQTRGSEEVTFKPSGETFSIIADKLYELDYVGEAGVINSKHHGVPQTRERVFIVGHLGRKRGRKIFPLGQISKEIVKQQRGVSQQCSSTLFAGQHKICRGMTLIDESLKINEIKQLNNPIHSNNRVYDSNGVCPILNTMQGGNRQPKIAIPILTPNRPNKQQNGRRFKENGESMFTLTAQDRHGVIIWGGLQEHQTPRNDGISPTLTSAMGLGGGQIPIFNSINQRIRRLIPVECEKLQGFPVNWTKYGIINGKKKLMSDTQRYKMCGNAVTTNVIEAIAREILKGDIQCVTD